MFRRMAPKHRTPERIRLQSLLKEIRLNSGLTQTEMATRLGRPQSYVSKYEIGERKLDFLELREICRVAGISSIDFARQFEEK